MFALYNYQKCNLNYGHPVQLRKSMTVTMCVKLAVPVTSIYPVYFSIKGDFINFFYQLFYFCNGFIFIKL